MTRNFILFVFLIGAAACSTQDHKAFSFTGELNDREFQTISAVAPIYPEKARRNFIEGYVGISYTVHPDGSVGDFKVLEEYPEGVFFEAAVEAVRQSKYLPRRVDGAVVPTERRQLFRFKLSDDMIRETCQNQEPHIKNDVCKEL